MGTLSTTLLDQIPGDKHVFLTNLLPTSQVRIQDEPVNQTYSITGLLEDIVSCYIKLSKFVVTASHQFVSDDKNFQKSFMQTYNPVTLTNSFDLKEEVAGAEKNCTEVSHSEQNTEDGNSSLSCENDNGTVTFGKEGKENDGPENKEHSFYEYLSPNDGHKKRKKSRKAQNVEHQNETEESQTVQIMTKRGRLVKKPTKLDSSVLLLDRLDDNTSTPETSNSKKIRRRKKFVPLEKPVDNQTDENLQEIEGMEDNGESDRTDDAKEDRTAYLKLEQPVHRNQEDHNYESSISISKDVKRQIRKHYEDRMPYRYFCQKCSFKSKRESHFNNHMQLHEKNPNLKLIKCEKCDYTCIRQSLLKKHQLCHESTALQCETCNYKTDNQKNLDSHIQEVHKSQKVMYRKHKYKFECTQCSFKTTDRSEVMSHIESHIDIGSALHFSCSECSYSTRKRVHFERHRKHVHSNRRPFLCDLCGAAFKR